MTRFFRPQSLFEALEILADSDVNAVPVAGCTDLMVVDHAIGRIHPGVVDMLSIPELQGIRRIERDSAGAMTAWIDIGAATTFSELRSNELITSELPILAEAAGTVGAWQIQSRATLGGNIANASPAGDSLPVLLALGAEVLVAGMGGERMVPYSEMHLGYRQTALHDGEIIVRVMVPEPGSNRVQCFKKVGTREAQAISKVVLAMSANLEGGSISGARIGAGSVAATPVRLSASEAYLEGRSVDVETADGVMAVVRTEVAPIDDVRSTADYRRFVLGTVLRRMVLQMKEAS